MPTKKIKKKLWENLNKGQKNIEEIKKPQSWSSSYNLYYVIYFSQYFKTHSSKTHKTIYFWKPYWILKKIEKMLFAEISICWHQQYWKWMNFSKIPKEKRLSINVSYSKLFQIALFSPKKATIGLLIKLKKKNWKNLRKGKKNIEEIKKPQFWSSSYNLYYVIYFSQYFKTHSSKTHKTRYFWKPCWILKKNRKMLFSYI